MAPKSQNKRTLKSHFYHFRRKVLGYVPKTDFAKKEPYFLDKKTPINHATSGITDSKSDKNVFQDTSVINVSLNDKANDILEQLHELEEMCGIEEDAPLPVLIKKDENEYQVGILHDYSDDTDNPDGDVSEKMNRNEKNASELATQSEQPPVLVGRDLDEKAQESIKELFMLQKDNNLIYPVFLSVMYLYSLGEIDDEHVHKAQTYKDFLILEKWINLVKTRRDLPAVIYQPIRQYLEALPNYTDLPDLASYPSQSEETYIAHQNRTISLKYFIQDLENRSLIPQFCKRLAYDLTDLQNGFPVIKIAEEKEPVEALLAKRELNERAQNRILELFPAQKDNGLIYAISISIAYLYHDNQMSTQSFYDAQTYLDYLSLDNVIKISKRRDFPALIRRHPMQYVESLASFQMSAPKQADYTYDHHKEYARYFNQFIKHLKNEDLVPEFAQRLLYDIQDLMNGFPIKEMIGSEIQSPVDNKVQWINPVLIENRSTGSNKENEYYRPYLNRLSDKAVNTKPRLMLADESFFDTLTENFPNFIEVVQYYKAQFRLNRFTQKERINPVLLLGEPGIGKTHFAKALAKMLNTGYTFIDLASTTDSWVLSGLHASWRGGKPGKFFEAMVNSPTLSPVVLLDEIEKTSGGGGKGNDATTPLYQILEETNAREFVDEFVDLPADLSHLIIIACANTLLPLSEPLQSRFRIFTIPSPTEDQYYSILQSVYEDETAKSGVFEPELSKEVISQLLSCSIREAKVKIAEAIGQVLLELTVEEMDSLASSGNKIRLKIQHLNTVLHRPDKMGF
jgi:DNA replication protein DnaC